MSSRIEVNFSGVSRPMSHLTYHRYVLRALASTGARVRITPWQTALARRLDHSEIAGARLLHRSWAWSNPKDPAPYVRYTVTDRQQRRVRLVLDTSDGSALRHPDALTWCDVYYKTNYWRGVSYPDKVRPLMNANGKLSARGLAYLRRLRSTRKTRGLIFWSRIWEPTDTGHYSIEQARNVLEHQIRVFETLSKAGIQADLLAILPKHLRTQEPASVARRLASCGVRVQEGWERIGTKQLWDALASARVVMLRPGFHQSVSWRMTDLLAMGSCILCEANPYPIWHVPLQPGRHFAASSGCTLSPEFELPAESTYDELRDRAEALLEQPQHQSCLGQAAGAYFDAHGSPQRFGLHLLTNAFQATGLGDVHGWPVQPGSARRATSPMYSLVEAK